MRAQLDQEKNITALVPRQPLEVHETVAECMIYANHWVARKIQEAFPHQALLRRHPPPRQEFFSQLVDSAEIRGFRMDTRWSISPHTSTQPPMRLLWQEKPAEHAQGGQSSSKCNDASVLLFPNIFQLIVCVYFVQNDSLLHANNPC